MRKLPGKLRPEKQYSFLPGRRMIPIFTPAPDLHQFFVVKFRGIWECVLIDLTMDKAVAHKDDLYKRGFFHFFREFFREDSDQFTVQILPTGKENNRGNEDTAGITRLAHLIQGLDSFVQRRGAQLDLADDFFRVYAHTENDPAAVLEGKKRSDICKFGWKCKTAFFIFYKALYGPFQIMGDGIFKDQVTVAADFKGEIFQRAVCGFHDLIKHFFPVYEETQIGAFIVVADQLSVQTGGNAAG